MDSISDADFAKQKLNRLRGQWRRVAAESEVPYTTIKNFMQGRAKFPRVPTLEKLVRYLRAEGAAQ